MTKKRLKTISRNNPGGGNSGVGSTQFTNAEDMKNRFFNNAANRRKAGSKAHGDAGYWTGGRCNWGGSHNLQEDSEELAKFFNSLADIDNLKREMTLAVNEQEFNTRKSRLVSELQSCISKCQTSDYYSVASVCCIWDDYFGSFLKPFLNRFQQKLQADLSNIQSITPIHQQEIIQLEAEIKATETKYQENSAKANQETDPSKKAKLIVAVNEALDEIKRLKNKYSQNPIASLGKFDYSNDWQRLIDGNLTSESSTLPNKSVNSNRNLGEKGQASQTSWTGSSENNSNPQNNQQQLLIFAGIVLLIIFYFYTQKEEEIYNF